MKFYNISGKMKPLKIFQSSTSSIPFSFFIISMLILNTIALSSGYSDDSDPYRHTRVLDREGKYVLDWQVDWEENRVFFNVTVQTRGYVGFGLSKKGLMDGADIVIGGVYPNGKPYFSDRHGVGHQAPKLDDSQDYILHSAWESKTHTFLSFSRLIETCDEANDLPINEDALTLIWAFGERDNEQEYHYQNRGDFPAYLLDADLTPREVIERSYRNVTTPISIPQLGDIKVWNIPVSQVMPAQDTTYSCTIHKAPTRTKHHIVGFRPVFKSDVERRHIHHYILHICYAPTGVDPNEMFGRFVGQPYEECYEFFSGRYSIPTQYCQEMRHEYGIGAGPVFFPEHVGLPLSETPDEYYLWQIHYDNPQKLPNVKLEFSLEVFYTDKLRKYDSGLLFVGHSPSAPTIMIPPSARDHQIYGYCAAQCTQKMLPKTGINVFASKLHTHLAGRGFRLLHVQGKQELPLTIDDNFNFNFQPFRIYREEKKIFPGDMLVSRCVYETTDRNGSVTVGGYATRDEMCSNFVSYYPYIRSDTYGICASEIVADAYRTLLQIDNTTWSDERKQFIVGSPPINAGLTATQAGNRIDWTIDKRAQLQAHQRFIPQRTWCPSLNPDTVTRTLEAAALLLSAPRPEPDRSGTFSELNKEILDPTSQFMALWPKHLVPYQRTSKCSKE